ncbi:MULTISPECIES: recombinase family protein [Aeromonas]|jgi:DNA invertase Pin-like site-specific DNA recombinase|uniref:recombinase family protein n=1 Tax=Aeromonas TaxID=642 RepID=UPI0003A62C90|nr:MULTISPECIES: recombinase family protein [Aeromonas]MDE8812311.1 recombinase family protein [Aeromonas hydrophila]NBA15882.1 recombinase family protein [Aeromonas caviae]USP63463.1 recombinase family protein [Aeromonas caviae]HAT2492587.1 recombinase family protein [Aeromonas hydrophila]HAT2497422.1 recombinase family protein [Aeromonas hydrophila]
MNLMSSAPTLYLYSRVSTEKQAAGNKTGVQRQTEGALVEATKAKYSSMPVVHMSDNGMSASKGENIEHGRLGDFIELCRSGQIAPGSVLAMENIDRFSRLALTRASEYLTCVLAANVFVYTWIDGAVYQKDNLASAIFALVKLESSNDYTNRLSARVTGAARVALKRHLDGVRDTDGYPAAINGFGKNKFWVDTTTGFVRPHPYYFPVVKEVIVMIREGKGHITIKKYLDENYTPPTIAQNSNKEGWGINLIKKIISDRAVLGEKIIHIDGREHLLGNYYPAVCTEAEFAQAKRVRSEKKQFTSKLKSAMGIVTGMRIATCGNCGSSLQVYRSKAGKKDEKLRYKCSGRSDTSVKSCTAATFDNRYFEYALMLLIGSVILQPKKNTSENKIASIKNKIESISSKIEIMIQSVGATTEGDIHILLTERLDKLSRERKKLNEELTIEISHTEASINPDIYMQIPRNFIDYNQADIRDEVRDIIYKTVKSVKVHSVTSCFYIQVELFGGMMTDGIVIDNKYISDFGFDMHHQQENEDAFLAYNRFANNFECIDKDGRCIRMLDMVNGTHFITSDDFYLNERVSTLKNQAMSEEMRAAIEKFESWVL